MAASLVLSLEKTERPDGSARRMMPPSRRTRHNIRRSQVRIRVRPWWKRYDTAGRGILRNRALIATITVESDIRIAPAAGERAIPWL